MSRVVNTSCKIVVKDTARTMPRAVNTLSMTVVKGTHKTHGAFFSGFHFIFIILFILTLVLKV